MAEMSVLSFPEFRQFVAGALGVHEGVLAPETHFLFDLGVESLKLVELMLQFQTQLGSAVSPDAAWEILTVGDAYNYYLKAVGGGVAPAEAPLPASVRWETAVD